MMAATTAARIALRVPALRSVSTARLPVASAAAAAAANTTQNCIRGLHMTKVARAVVVEDEKDPQLGDYQNPAMENTQLRRDDPRYYDRQEKRNFGETLHEQDDVLGVFSPDVHPNVKPSSAVFQLGVAASIFASFAGLVYYTLPDRPAQRRTYPRDGLAEELGGEKVAAFAHGAFDKQEGEGEEEEEEDEE